MADAAALSRLTAGLRLSHWPYLVSRGMSSLTLAGLAWFPRTAKFPVPARLEHRPPAEPVSEVHSDFFSLTHACVFSQERLARTVPHGDTVTYKKSVVLLALWMTSISAFANDYGGVRGIVHDPQHRPIQGAMIMLKAKLSDWAKTVNTDANGEFQFNAVPLGEYSVSLASQGFAQTSQDVVVISGSVPVVHFQLQLASAK